MNTKKQMSWAACGRIVATAATGLAVAWLVGCNTTVYKQGDRTADAAWAAAMQVQTECQALAAVQATLNGLVDKPAADLRPQFMSFSSSLDVLVSAAKRAEVSGEHLVRSNANFVAAWDKQLTTITNAEVRSTSEARKTEVSKQFDAAHKHFLEAQDALRPLVSYLQDIRKALSADLTPGGVAAVKELAGNANTTTGKVQTDLAQAMADLKALSAAMSSTRAPGAS